MSSHKVILVTGGCGFIGANFLLYVCDKYPNYLFIVVDSVTEQSSFKNLVEKPNSIFIFCDITNYDILRSRLSLYKIDEVIHFAAETDVDKSFVQPLIFTKTNVLGTHNLLEYFRKEQPITRFIHISTDEVYGEKISGTSEVGDSLHPTSPYSASKAAGEFIVNAYIKSYNMPCIIIRPNNVYGIRQYKTKIISKFIVNLLNDVKCPIHGDGSTSRNFLNVLDAVSGIETIWLKGKVGEIYNIGSHDEYSVMDILKILVDLIKPGEDPKMWCEYVSDRLYNDKRYAVNNDKLLELGWEPKVNFFDGVKETIDWYKNIDHSDYWNDKSPS
jgi:dTDP-glucose 4,6-dehydratase